ncbi:MULTISPECIES: hypothetical protein [Cyanophyceae]|uniref:hypothetical protein n=1 Tax=Cyanophyceae TaxID=3028117 RepID=UPI0016876815|nr:hypothetical protein [Trichocoleus sp. FACHB-69]MBD1933066.1 hypothetical protein [Trichocoleus sp. FACHB-69]
MPNSVVDRVLKPSDYSANDQCLNWLLSKHLPTYPTHAAPLNKQGVKTSTPQELPL